jgi:hypothetical protein
MCPEGHGVLTGHTPRSRGHEIVPAVHLGGPQRCLFSRSDGDGYLSFRVSLSLSPSRIVIAATRRPAEVVKCLRQKRPEPGRQEASPGRSSLAKRLRAPSDLG